MSDLITRKRERDLRLRPCKEITNALKHIVDYQTEPNGYINPNFFQSKDYNLDCEEYINFRDQINKFGYKMKIEDHNLKVINYINTHIDNGLVTWELLRK